MKRIAMSCLSVLLMLVCLVAANTTASAGANSSFSLNVVHPKGGNGTLEVKSEGSKELLHVSKKPLLTQTDFTQAKVLDQGGRTILQLTLNDSGASKLVKFSKQHVGERLAVLLDGQLVGAPVIRVPIEGNALQVDAFTKAQANQLAEVISQRK